MSLDSKSRMSSRNEPISEPTIARTTSTFDLLNGWTTSLVLNDAVRESRSSSRKRIEERDASVDRRWTECNAAMVFLAGSGR